MLHCLDSMIFKKYHFRLIILTAVLLLQYEIPVFAQQGSDFAFKRKLKEAEAFLELEDYKSAEQLFLTLLPKDSLNEKVNLGLGICMYLQKQQPEKTLSFLLRAEKGSDGEVHYFLGRVYHLLSRFDEAIEQLGKYKDLEESKRKFDNLVVDRSIEMCKRAKYEIQQPHKALIKNLGSAINTKFPEYVPLVSGDESILFFTSRRPGSTGNQVDAEGNYYEDIYVSYKKNNAWSSPENIGLPINTETHDACVSLSLDAQQMLFFRTSYDLSSGDLYQSEWNGKAWSEGKKLGSQINTPAKELSACTNNDNSIIVFSSDREGGFGGKDLYRVVKLPNGEWSQAQNLGPKINSMYDEDAPFISSNGQYLYFSSNGIKTIGGYDIFKIDFYQEASIAEPQNLGYPINSIGDDIFFVISADGKHGYYSSLNMDKNDPNYLSEDIFLIDRRYSENETRIKKGICKFANDVLPEQVQISVFDEVTKRLIGTYKPQKRDGSFIFVVNPYDAYKIVAEASNFETITIDFKPLVEQEDYDIEQDVIILEFKKP